MKVIFNRSIRVAALLQKADSSLGYLRIITPKSSRGQVGVTKIIGKSPFESMNDIDKSNFRPLTNWTGKNMDPDSVRRHNISLKRAGFKDNTHAKGFF